MSQSIQRFGVLYKLQQVLHWTNSMELKSVFMCESPARIDAAQMKRSDKIRTTVQDYGSTRASRHAASYFD